MSPVMPHSSLVVADIEGTVTKLGIRPCDV